MSSITIILKIEVSPDSHWKLQFSNPEKVQNLRKMTPPPLSEGLNGSISPYTHNL